MYSFSSGGTLQQARWRSWQCSMDCFPVLARLSKTRLGSSLSRWEGEGRAFPLCLNACFPHRRWWLGIRMSSISGLGVNNTRGKLSSAMKISTKLSLRSPNLLHLRSVFYFWWSLGRISLDCHLQLYVSEIIFIFCSCSVYKDQANVRSAVVNSTASQPPMWEVTNSMIPCSEAPLKESHALFSLTWALETGFLYPDNGNGFVSCLSLFTCFLPVSWALSFSLLPLW